jgi:ferredoxin-thioredoxin reductase catalytic subunit/rubredoxin
MMDIKEKAQQLYQKLKAEAEAGGYILNPDVDFTLDLMEGLSINQDRYGYLACPCRDADGVREKDLDLICPCDYRDPDLAEYGACYCALYVSDAVAEGTQSLKSIPERRPTEAERAEAKEPDPAPNTGFGGASEPVWRCKVCGYLCARSEPPLKCPICKADKDRFERFATQAQPVWRCKVCGYLCACPEPPLKCPICKADKDRFEPFG